MRLNFGRIQSTAQNQPEYALHDSREDSCLAPFERSNSNRPQESFLECNDRFKHAFVMAWCEGLLTAERQHPHPSSQPIRLTVRG